MKMIFYFVILTNFCFLKFSAKLDFKKIGRNGVYKFLFFKTLDILSFKISTVICQKENLLSPNLKKRGKKSKAVKVNSRNRY